MELNQIFLFTNWRLFILLLLLPYLISLFSNLFCEGNEPNGVKSNICFFTKWRLFILLLLIPNLKTFFFKHNFVKAINQMELIQIFVLTKGGFLSFYYCCLIWYHYLQNYFIKAMNQMELNQILVFLQSGGFSSFYCWYPKWKHFL